MSRWNGKDFELVPTSDGSQNCFECFFYQFIEQNDDHVPCEAMGSECCEEGNMGKVFKEIISP